VIRLLALAATAVLALSGCGGGDDDSGGSEDGSAATTTTTAAPEAEGNTFEASDVGFTFTYPDGFEQLDEPNDGDALASVTPTPTDPKNGIKIRETAAQELAFDSYSADIHSQFEEQLGVKVSLRDETHADLDMGVMEWTNSVTFQDLGQEKTTEIHSTSYFFVASGKTWQLECISAEDQRDAIDAACEQAIESIEPS
jgi:hypothetical protein